MAIVPCIARFGRRRSGQDGGSQMQRRGWTSRDMKKQVDPGLQVSRPRFMEWLMDTNACKDWMADKVGGF